MTAVEHQILDTLDALDQAACPTPGTPKPDLLALFARLDQLERALPPDAPADLRHYLARKSYAKARLLLAGRDTENAAGACGR